MERSSKGQFLKGNRGGPGNPHAASTAKLRAALHKTVTALRLKKIVESLLKEAENGNVSAAKIVLDRVLGKIPDPIDIEARIAELENRINVTSK